MSEIYTEELRKQYTNEIKTLVDKYPHSYKRMIMSKGFHGRYKDRTYLYEFILNETKFLDDDNFPYQFKTRVFFVYHELKDWENYLVKCMACKNPLKCKNIKNIRFGFKKTCSKSCERDLAKKTFGDRLEAKYGKGIRNPYQIPEVIEDLKSRQQEMDLKKKATRIEHFGDPNFNNSKKACQTKIEKYGSVWNLAKCKETWIEKYGVENPMQNAKIAEKQKSAAYVYDNKKFDSSLEIYYYIYMKDHNIQIEYHPEEPQLWYQKKDQSWHRYYPDFLLVETNQLVETKGNNAFDEDGNPLKNGWDDWTEKYECMRKNNVLILLSDDVEKYKKYVEEKYGKEFIEKIKILCE